MTYLNKQYNQVIVNSLDDLPIPVGGIITLEHEKEYLLNQTIYCPYTVRFLTSSLFSTTHRLGATTLGTHAWIYTGTGYAFEAIDYGGDDTFGTVQINDIVLAAPFGSVFNIDGTSILSVLFFNRGAIQSSGSIGIVKKISYYQFFTACSGFDQGLEVNNLGLGIFANNVFLAANNVASCDFINVTGDATLINITNNTLLPQSNESFLNINSASTIVAGNVSNNVYSPILGGNFFRAGSKDYTDIYWTYVGNAYLEESSVTAEANLIGNVLTTILSLQNAWRILNTSGYTVDSNELQRLTISTEGYVTYDGLETVTVACDSDVNALSVTASYDYAIRFIIVRVATYEVTFTNATNTVNRIAHGLNNGDTISFKRTAGTLPTGVTADDVYYVINAATDTFQISRTLGGAAVTFTDDGTPTNVYSLCEFHGSLVPNLLTNSKAAVLSTKALLQVSTGDNIYLVGSNRSGAVNLDVIDSYIRIKK